MSDSEAENRAKGVKLTSSNYNVWAVALQGKLMTVNAWRIVTENLKRPVDVGEADKWLLKREEAAGIILRSLAPTQYVHVEGIMDDPVEMWNRLRSAHRSQVANSRFHAMQKLLSIRKDDVESLTDYITRINTATNDLIALAPSTLTVQNIIDEVGIHAAITGLDHVDYGAFTSSLLLLGTLDRAAIATAFRNEDLKRQASSTSSTAALSAAQKKRSGITTCSVCKKRGHLADRCWIAHPELRPVRRGEENERNTGANQAREHTQNGATQEFAGNASLRPMYLSSASSDADRHWNTDTGATSHMTPHRYWLQDYKPHRVPIRLATNEIVYSAGKGNVLFTPIINGKLAQNIIFSQVLHVPALQNNLLAVLYLTTHHGFSVNIVRDQISFTQDGKLRFCATVQNGIGFLTGDTVPNPEHALATPSPVVDRPLLHKRLAHIGHARLERLITDDMANGIHVNKNTEIPLVCEPCIAAKQHRRPFPKKSENRAIKPLDLVVSDVHGPLPVRTPSGHRYWITFTDDCTRYRCVYLLRTKDEAFDAYKSYEAFAENQTNSRVRRFRDDKGGEYIGQKWTQHFQHRGIIHEHTTRGTPQQNGISERTNRTLTEGIIALLQQAHLPASMWGDALKLLVRIINATPTSALPDKTPYEAWNGRKPDLGMLRTFGCTAYVHVQKNERNGLQPKSRKCIYLGFESGYKGWRCLDVITKRVVVSRDVIFDESEFPGLSITASTNEPLVPLPALLPIEGDGAPEAQPHLEPAPDIQPPPELEPEPEPDPLLNPPADPDPPPPRRSGRATTRHNYRQLNDPLLRPCPAPDHDDPGPEGGAASRASTIQALEFIYNDLDITDANEASSDIELVFNATIKDDRVPKTFAEAMQRPDAPLWKGSTDAEIQALLDNGTWELVSLPPGEKAIGSRWVFRIKLHSDGSLDKYKSRLVAKGYTQRPGIDYDEVFAPTTRWAALRAILAQGALQGAHIESIDISNAYLNGVLGDDARIYMKQPEGYHQGGADWVCKLKRGLYGLKQSGRLWYERLGTALEGMGFKRLQSDPSVYVWMNDTTRIVIPVFVDDLTLVSDSKLELDRVKKELAKIFKLKDLGQTTSLLGVEVKYDRSQRTLRLSQKQYIREILERFQMSDCRPVSTPMTPGLNLNSTMGPSTPEEIQEMQNIPYLNAVGALNYLAIATRPDIAYTVGCLARFNSNPGPAHWAAVKHLLRYLQGTIDLALTFAPDHSTESFQTWTDADHGGNTDNGRSTSGFLTKIGTGAVSWASKLQNIVTLSTTESEFVASVLAGTEIVWLRSLFDELGSKPEGPSHLYIDNQSALSVAKNPEHHGRMKHLDLRYFWLREKVVQKTIQIGYVPTGSMPADILTKALPRELVERHRRTMGLF
jgi:transposase InsO family protein